MHIAPVVDAEEPDPFRVQFDAYWPASDETWTMYTSMLSAPHNFHTDDLLLWKLLQSPTVRRTAFFKHESRSTAATRTLHARLFRRFHQSPPTEIYPWL